MGWGVIPVAFALPALRTESPLPQTKALLRMWGVHCKHQESPMKTRMSVVTAGKLFKKY